MYLHMLSAYGVIIVMFITTILRNKIVKHKVGKSRSVAHNVSLIYNKTSLGKGGMIGTMYPNHHSVITSIVKHLSHSEAYSHSPPHTYILIINLS